MTDALRPSDTLTPMLQQYFEAKAAHPDAILFFRLGDFYEMFFEDAVEASKILEITLTSRGRERDGEPIPMCGIPHHAAEGYLHKLLEAGRKVALCDQVEDPRKARGIVKREIVQVVTPGVRFDAEGLEAGKANHLLALVPAEGGAYGLAWADVSTGSLVSALVPDRETLARELVRIEPSEVLVPEATDDARALVAAQAPGAVLSPLPPADFSPTGLARVPDVVGVADLTPPQWGAVAAIMAFLGRVNPAAQATLTRVEGQEASTFLTLDPTARRNLELFETLFERRRKGSLLGSIDRTLTPMGARLLRDWLSSPLLSLTELTLRHDAVAELVENRASRAALRRELDRFGDLERLTARALCGVATPRDLGSVRAALARLPALRSAASELAAPLLREAVQVPEALAEVADLLARALVESPPPAVRDGGFIRAGYHPPLDEWTGLKTHARDWLLEYQEEERARTGISNLKVGYNRVFGYYLDVTRTNVKHVPDDYIRKQTTATGERYYTPVLKEHETRIAEADARLAEIEAELFEELRRRVAAVGQPLLEVARGVARLDVLTALAEVAEARGFVRPTVDASLDLVIVGGRHPMVEETLPRGRFIPNDFVLAGDTKPLAIVTGPNMAGKSTLMRQVALIALLAQAGSFVPADEARIGLVDGIFTRVGASDNLAGGQSTFMVEMLETSQILRRATRRSLILLDEIGRGTSTFDGLSIAWAVAEHLHDRVRARTLFATHYHELTDLERTKPGVRNLSVAVKEWNDEILFLRKLVEGGTSRSYGIQVAKLAGLPPDVVERAREVLKNLEEGELDAASRPRLSRGRRQKPVDDLQLALFVPPEARREETFAWLRDELMKLDPDRTTPLDALAFLSGLRRRLGPS